MKKEKQPSSQEITVPIHFIGMGTYDIKSFVKEAKKYGVSRAIPISVASGMNFGKAILLAQYHGGCRAYIFGGFVVNGFSPINLSHDEMKRLKKKLDVVKDVQSAYQVERMCGTYTVTSCTYINDTLKECMEVLKEIKSDAKILLNGVYFDVEKPFTHYPVCFTRCMTYTKIKYQELGVKLGKKQLQVSFITNYQRR